MENQENSQQALKAKEISRKDPMVIFASFFYVGFIKKAPGTFGSLAALPFLILYQLSGAPKAFIIPLLIITTVLSIYICQKIQDVYQILDPKWVVVDELLGMLV
ncbi:MAG: phosphatidylglycerophosphatase A, partial [Bacteriovoracaceae bacterium]